MSAWLSPGKKKPPDDLLEPSEGSDSANLQEVFCDWLDLTFDPSEDLVWLNPLIAGIGGVLLDESCFKLSNGGTIKHQKNRRWQRLSLSGRALASFRGFSSFDELLSCISRQPYKITRLDAAYDVPVDGSVVVSELWGRYRASGVHLNVLNAVNAGLVLGKRFDGADTGTFYAGDRRKNRIMARVYDKQHEIFERTRSLVPPRTRYEVTVKTDQATLRDVAEPAALFWHYASPSLLQAPDNVPVWSPGNPYIWEPSKIEPQTLEDRLYRVVYGSGDLNAAMSICGASADAFEYLRKLCSLRISQRIDQLQPSR